MKVNAALGPFAIGANYTRCISAALSARASSTPIAPNWSVKGEYLYSMYGSERYFGGVGLRFGDIDTHRSTRERVGIIRFADSRPSTNFSPGFAARAFSFRVTAR